MALSDSSDPGVVRLSKFLSDAGVASRRHAEEMILAGRVTVNDEVVNALPAFVRPERDAVTVDGKPVRAQRLEYWMIYKPKGFLCTDSDPDNRHRVVDLLPPHAGRVFPVGRLEMETMGLLLMTNDGELAQRLMHPRFGVPKVYRAEVVGRVGRELPATLRDGVWLSDGKARATGVEIIHVGRDSSVLEITLSEGKNRQVHRMLAHCGHKVRRLTRVAIGPLSLKGLPLGASRALARGEIAELKRAVETGAPGLSRPRGIRSAGHGRGAEQPARGDEPGRRSDGGTPGAAHAHGSDGGVPRTRRGPRRTAHSARSPRGRRRGSRFDRA